MILDLGDQRVGVVVDEVREVLRVDSTHHHGPGADGERAGRGVHRRASSPGPGAPSSSSTRASCCRPPSGSRCSAMGSHAMSESLLGRALRGQYQEIEGGSMPRRTRPTARPSSATSSPSSSGWTAR